METIHNSWLLVGIIGGTGPESSNYFTSLLIKLRGEVRRDQEYIPFLPQITDRLEKIVIALSRKKYNFERVDFLEIIARYAIQKSIVARTSFVNNKHLWHFTPPDSKF